MVEYFPIDNFLNERLRNVGFDLDDINEACDVRGLLVTPVIYFARQGNFHAYQYLFSLGADWFIFDGESSGL